MLIKVFSTSIWSCWNGEQSLLYFDLELLECNRRSSLLRSGLLECRSKVFSTSIQNDEMLIKGLLYFNLELVKCQSRPSPL